MSKQKYCLSGTIPHRSNHYTWHIILMLPRGVSWQRLALGNVQLQLLSFHLGTDVIDKYVFECLAPLKHLETVVIRFRYELELAPINIYNLVQDLDKLSEMIFVLAEISTTWIKHFLRQIIQPLKLSIRFQTCFFAVSEDDCNEIANLLKAHPDMRFRVEIINGKLSVSPFISYKLLPYKKNQFQHSNSQIFCF